jgi:hypothetical protein
MQYSPSADVGVFIRCRVPGDPPVDDSGLVRPLIGVFHLPGPHHPALAAVLVGLGLRLPVLAHEVLVFLAERGRIASQPRAAAGGGAAVQGAVIMTAGEASEQMRSAIVVRGRPFADDGLQGRLGQDGGILARTLDVLLVGHVGVLGTTRAGK